MKSIGMKTIVFLILPFVIQFGLISCDCPKATQFNYAFESIAVVNIDNSGFKPQVSEKDSVLAKAYGMRLTLERKIVAHNKPPFSIVSNTAFAFSKMCPVAVYSPKSTIKNIKIVTLNNFDETHLAGTEITSLFKVYENMKYKEWENEIKKNNAKLRDQEMENAVFDIVLLSTPSQLGMHSFRVEAELTDGNILIDTISVKLY